MTTFLILPIARYKWVPEVKCIKWSPTTRQSLSLSGWLETVGGEPRTSADAVQANAGHSDNSNCQAGITSQCRWEDSYPEIVEIQGRGR